MVPDYFCIQFLQQNSFIRNISIDRLLDKHNNVIPLHNYICYTVGIVDSKRVVNAFQFLFESSNTKIKSYYIRWWNTAAFETISFRTEYESIDFWVHSGMTLRKNFFLYEDRMSLLRSTFIYDPSSSYYFRLINLIDYILIPPKSNYQQQIYTSPSKFSYNYKHNSTKSKENTSIEEKQIAKILKKLIQSRNLKMHLEKVSPSLFHEINRYINHGNSPHI